jgi:hypothetical protein
MITPDSKKVSVNVPDHCQLCQAKLLSTVVDGATKGGPWAWMCGACFVSNGVGLGLGKGQVYSRDLTDEWEQYSGRQAAPQDH